MACYNNIIIPQIVTKYRRYLGRHVVDEDRIINTAADDVQETT